MPTPVVIDLSHWNTVPESLKPAREAGIVGVIHKMSEGRSNVDDKVDARWHLAKEAGMAWGLYHFIRPGDPLAQAEFFWANAQTVSDEATLLALDWEDPGVPAEDALRFLERLEELSEREPVLYSGHVCKEDPDPRLNAYRLWLAQYASACSLPSFSDGYWLWQYTDKGQVAGITPPTDLNAYDGDVADMLAEWSGGIASPDSRPVVRILVDASPDVRVEVQVLGDE